MGVDIDKLEALAKAATPGLWKVVASDKYAFTVAILPPDFPQTPLVGRIRDEHDAAYIVAACNSLPDLIAENRVLKGQVQRLEMRVADYIEERDALVCTKYALEQQRDWLSKKCEELSDDPEDFFMPYNIPAKTWIERAEQTIKEVGE